jgi:hypothetical protein
MKDKLKVGMKIYEKQARWFEFDYHPQEITKIKEETISVFEAGCGENGTSFEIKISSLFTEKVGNEIFIMHY